MCQPHHRLIFFLKKGHLFLFFYVSISLSTICTWQMLRKYFRVNGYCGLFYLTCLLWRSGPSWSLWLISTCRILWPSCFLQSSTDGVMVRTGSLQLSSSAVGTLSLKRTKRKAPAPPSKTPLQQNDENSAASDNGILLWTVGWLWLWVLIQSVKAVWVLTFVFLLLDRLSLYILGWPRTP